MSLKPVSAASLAAMALAATTMGGAGARAETTGFDLAGPTLRVTVTHAGATLPLSQVPNLSVGDRLRIAVDLPPEQGARYRMVLAFLRGATNPPPKDWLLDAQTWKPKKATIEATVPEGTEQAVLLLVPDTGGALGAVAAAVRGRPGAFVRASQELDQAMLDRARLAAFVDHVARRDPADLARTAPQLAKNLAVKLDTDCLLRRPDARAACLTQGSNAAVLADGQTNSIAQTLAGAPADIALQLSSTPQAGFGYYSPYVGVIRDVARLLGAFQSAQLQFIPALSVQRGDTTGLLLNAAPSFRKPQSVLVAALPAVAPPATPPLAATTDAPACLARPDLVLPVSGAPLVFATAYARDMRLRIAAADGRSVELPVAADPVRGGYVVTADPANAAAGGPTANGVLHGDWGFQPFNGPSFRLVAPAGRRWSAAKDATLVVGRDTPLRLSGGAAACVASVEVEVGGERRPVAWTAEGQDAVSLQVPLVGAAPGPVTVAVRSWGEADPQRLELRAYAEAGRLVGFTLHAGDRDGVLAGARLDQVATLELGGATFRPGGLTREGDQDRLAMTSVAGAADGFAAGRSLDARVTSVDGRTTGLRVTIAAPRPRVTLVGETVERPAPGGPLTLALPGDAVTPTDARLVFSFRAAGDARLAPTDVVEVEAEDGGRTATLPLRLQDPQVGIAELAPAAAFGPSAFGPVRFRVVRNGVAGDWAALTRVVRLPSLTAIACPSGAGRCSLSGSGLFLLRSVSDGNGAQDRTDVPSGFTADVIEVPRPVGGRLTVSLRDAPDMPVDLRTPA